MPLCHLPQGELFYREKGNGEPLVFVNGLAGDHLYWLGQLRTFSKRYRCLAVDNRDAGQSISAAQPYTIQDMAADLAGLLSHLHLPPANIVGLSMGGMIAQELALAAPSLVKSLVLVSTLGRADDWFRGTLKAFELIREHVRDSAGFFDAVMPWWVSHQFFENSARTSWLRWLLQHNPHNQQVDGFRRQLNAIRKHDALERLGQIGCPVLILAGEDDGIVPSRYSQQLRSVIPQAHLVAIAGAGHALPIENPSRFTTEVSRFLENLHVPFRSSA